MIEHSRTWLRCQSEIRTNPSCRDLRSLAHRTSIPCRLVLLHLGTVPRKLAPVTRAEPRAVPYNRSGRASPLELAVVFRLGESDLGVVVVAGTALDSDGRGDRRWSF